MGVALTGGFEEGKQCGVCETEGSSLCFSVGKCGKTKLGVSLGRACGGRVGRNPDVHVERSIGAIDGLANLTAKGLSVCSGNDAGDGMPDGSKLGFTLFSQVGC